MNKLFVPPHEHEWDYTGTEVSDKDYYTPLYHEYECWNCSKVKRVQLDDQSSYMWLDLLRYF